MVCFSSLYSLDEIPIKTEPKCKIHFFKAFVLSTVFLLSTWNVLAAPTTEIQVSSLQIAPAGFIENDVPQGIFYDIAKLIILEAGYIPNIKILPYPRVVDNLVTGKADMSILISNEVIEKSCDAIAPITKIESIIVGLRGKDFPDLLSLQGKTVGIVRLASYDEEFDNNSKIEKYEINSYEQGLNMLFSKRFDAMMGTKISMYYTLARQGYSPEKLGQPLILNSKVIYLQYSKKSSHPQAKNKIAMAVKKLTAQGEIARIIASYIGKPRMN